MRDLIAMFEDGRDVMVRTVSTLVGAKAAQTMLAKTHERVGTLHPKLFRHSNWGGARGVVKADGALDADKLLKALGDLPEMRRGEVLIGALSDLMKERLSAIHRGLARKVRNAIVIEITDALGTGVREKRYKQGAVVFFLDRVLPAVV